MSWNRWSRLAVIGGFAVTLAACGAGAEREVDVPGITAEVEGAVASFFEAMNAHDGAAVIAHYVGAENFVYTGCTRVAMDWAVWSQRSSAWYDKNDEVEFHHEMVSLQVLAPTAAVTTVQGGSTEAEFLIWTQAWVKDDASGRWLIAAEHEAWPDCGTPPKPHVGTDTPS